MLSTLISRKTAVFFSTIVVLMLSPAVLWAQDGTMLILNSQEGDYIGQGQSRSFTPDTASFSATYDGSLLSVSVFPFDFGFWFVNLAAPPGEPLIPGTYEGAVRAAFRGAGEPGLDVFGDGRGCNTVTGRFEVTEAVYGPLNYVESFHATFEQHCEGAIPALFGEIRIENPPPPPILEIQLGIDGKGFVDQVTGAATVRGTISCSVPTEVFLSGRVVQRASRYVVIEAFFFTQIQCDGALTRWSATVEGSGVPFNPGRVEVAATASAFDPNYSQWIDTNMTVNVRLTGSKK